MKIYQELETSRKAGKSQFDTPRDSEKMEIKGVSYQGSIENKLKILIDQKLLTVQE